MASNDAAHPAPRILQWTAIRPTAGEPFCALVRPPAKWPTEKQLGRMELSPESLCEAVAPDVFERVWRDFVRDGDVFAYWDRGSLGLLRTLGVDAPCISLRAAYSNVIRARPGLLAQVVQREHFAPPALSIQGRARTALAGAAAVAQGLHDWSNGQLPV